MHQQIFVVRVIVQVLSVSMTVVCKLYHEILYV
jgi:hypothetical protein